MEQTNKDRQNISKRPTTLVSSFVREALQTKRNVRVFQLNVCCRFSRVRKRRENNRRPSEHNGTVIVIKYPPVVIRNRFRRTAGIFASATVFCDRTCDRGSLFVHAKYLFSEVCWPTAREQWKYPYGFWTYSSPSTITSITCRKICSPTKKGFPVCYPFLRGSSITSRRNPTV